MNCEYNLFNDWFGEFDGKLETIAENISDNKLELNIDELDIDLDAIEKQLTIANKLKLLESVGIDIMTEAEQKSAYEALKSELFDSASSGGEPTSP